MWNIRTIVYLYMWNIRTLKYSCTVWYLDILTYVLFKSVHFTIWIEPFCTRYILRVYKFLFTIRELWIAFISNTRWSTRRCPWNFDDTGKKIRIFKKKIQFLKFLLFLVYPLVSSNIFSQFGSAVLPAIANIYVSEKLFHID